MHKKVLVIGGDVMTSILDLQDRTTNVLFGDGAGAVLLEPSTDDTGIIDFGNEVDGAGACHLYMTAGGSLHPASHETVDRKEHFVRQDGAVVFKYAVRKFAEAGLGILERNGMTTADLDLFVPHQANLRIIDAVGTRFGLPEEKVVKNIAKFGNTTAATIPLALASALDDEAPEEGRRRAAGRGGRGLHRGHRAPALVGCELDALTRWPPCSSSRSASSSSCCCCG